MSFLDSFFGRGNGKKGSEDPSTSCVARERLQVLLSQERDAAKKEGDSNLLRVIHREILEVLEKHVNVDNDNVRVALERGKHMSKLEIDIDVPESGLKAQVSTTTANKKIH